jgi:hypothetical protein
LSGVPGQVAAEMSFNNLKPGKIITYPNANACQDEFSVGVEAGQLI